MFSKKKASFHGGKTIAAGTGLFYVRIILWAVLGALAFFLAFPNFFSLTGSPVLLLAHAVIFIHVLQKKSLKDRLLTGLVMGGLSYGLLVFWILPLDLSGYLVFVAALTLQPVIFSALCGPGIFRQRYKMFSLAALWVSAEFVRAFLLGGFSWSLGYAFHEAVYLRQIMDLTGPYGLSFAVIFISACLWQGWRAPRQIFRLLLYVGLVLIGLVAYGKFRIGDESFQQKASRLTVCTVQPNIPPQQKQDPGQLPVNLQEHIALTHACMEAGDPDMIIWPEVALPDDLIGHGWLFEKVTELATGIRTPLVIGSALLLEKKDYNSAVFIDSVGEMTGFYHKRKLIPFSEYYPFKAMTFLKKYLYKNSYDFTSGVRPARFRLQDQTVTPLICSEEFYPGLFRDLLFWQGVRAQPCLAITLLNDGWFNHEAALMMHAQAAVVQAVSFRTPIVRASNTGLSVYVDSLGNLFLNGKKGSRNLYLNERTFFLFNVSCKKSESFYSQYGDVFACLCLLFTIILTVLTCLSLGQIHEN